MTLTPEQIAQGWKLHDGSWGCPIKDNQTVHQVRDCSGWESSPDHVRASKWVWSRIIAYRIIEAHGADAEPARPTPFPASMADLVYDADGMSQAFFTGGVWPEWLPDNVLWQAQSGGKLWASKGWFTGELAIRVRRREPKRETVRCWVKVTFEGNGPYETGNATIDLIDGKPDLSTLKIAEGAL